MKQPLAVVAVLLLAGCATTPREDPVQLRLDDIDARVGRIDRIVSNQSLMQMAQQITAMSDEIRVLSGRIEELQNENIKLRKEQRDLYSDMDKRVTEAAAAAASAKAAASAAAAAIDRAPAQAPPDEQALYARALDELKARNYAVAVDILRNLSVSFPDGALADNTQYWLGEAYYVTLDFDQAATAFQNVLNRWPNSRKAPDALLKLGYTQAEQKNLPQARITLQQVVTKHPGTDAAKLAAERLSKLPK